MSAHRCHIAAFGATALLLCGGCQRVTHDMAEQPRHDPAMASPLFADRQATRPPPLGSIVHAAGDAALVSSGRGGLASDDEQPHAPSAALLQRGGERYAIYCLPCHGEHGDGDGEVVRRGFPAPPAMGSAALRAATDAQLYAAIRNGVGVMYPFADRVGTSDAWAVVAWLRQLQRDAPADPRSSTRPAPEARR